MRLPASGIAAAAAAAAAAAEAGRNRHGDDPNGPTGGPA
jgi:hypothetical protein